MNFLKLLSVLLTCALSYAKHVPPFFFPASRIHYVNHGADFPFKWMKRGMKSIKRCHVNIPINGRIQVLRRLPVTGTKGQKWSEGGHTLQRAKMDDSLEISREAPDTRLQTMSQTIRRPRLSIPGKRGHGCETSVNANRWLHCPIILLGLKQVRSRLQQIIWAAHKISRRDGWEHASDCNGRKKCTRYSVWMPRNLAFVHDITVVYGGPLAMYS